MDGVQNKILKSMILNHVSYSIITARAPDIRRGFWQWSYQSDSEVGERACPGTPLEEIIKIISQPLRRKGSLETQTHVSNLSKNSTYFQAHFIFFRCNILVMEIMVRIVLFLRGEMHTSSSRQFFLVMYLKTILQNLVTAV